MHFFPGIRARLLPKREPQYVLGSYGAQHFKQLPRSPRRVILVVDRQNQRQIVSISQSAAAPSGPSSPLISLTNKIVLAQCLFALPHALLVESVWHILGNTIHIRLFSSCDSGSGSWMSSDLSGLNTTASNRCLGPLLHAVKFHFGAYSSVCPLFFPFQI